MSVLGRGVLDAEAALARGVAATDGVPMSVRGVDGMLTNP